SNFILARSIAVPATGFPSIGRCAHSTRLGLGTIELGAAACELFRREAFDVAIVELPAGVIAPAQRRLHGGARRGGGFQQVERELQRDCWRVGVVRPAGGVAAREVPEQEPRYAHPR